MLRRAASIAGMLLVVLLTLGVAWLRGMRDKRSAVVRTQRRINRAVFNPQALRTAGMPGARESVVRHTGRATGRTYQTPVGAVPTESGFVIALVYGQRSDWVQNVLASGQAVVVHDGQTHHVHDPEVVPLASVTEISPRDQRPLRIFGVTECLRVRSIAEAPAG
jgi:deazaflavin-dependent oxidoreductase (nitroreductase family)